MVNHLQIVEKKDIEISNYCSSPQHNKNEKTSNPLSPNNYSSTHALTYHHNKAILQQ